MTPSFSFSLIFLLFVGSFQFAFPTDSNEDQQPFLDASTVPEQIHLSLGSSVNSMVFIWATQSYNTKSMVRYGTSSSQLNTIVSGYEDSYQTSNYKSPFFHYVILNGLKANTKYYYQVGDSVLQVWSQVYSFKTASDQKVPVTIGCVGDVGQTSHSVETMEGLLSTLNPELVIFVGDLSYADGNQPQWDTWGNLFQPYAVSVPWMFLPGNHENEKNTAFLSFDHRVLMTPGQSTGSGGGNNYYSFDYSWIHFVMLSSEMDYSRTSVQYQWLEKDLSKVNRQSTPWIVVSWHRPWYSSNTAHQGEAENMRKSIEDLLYKYQVDFCMTGHVHAYERTTRMYNFKTDPKGPYYFTIGDGGNREGLAATWQNPQPSWSSYRLAAYGFSAFHVYNQTHVHWVMHQDTGFAQADDIWIVKS